MPIEERWTMDASKRLMKSAKGFHPLEILSWASWLEFEAATDSASKNGSAIISFKLCSASTLSLFLVYKSKTYAAPNY